MKNIIGQRFEWETIGGDKYGGVITEIDMETVHVKCDDGVTRTTGLSEAQMDQAYGPADAKKTRGK